MAITLEKLCENTEERYNLKLIAGKDGLKSAIRWVHMVEDSEVPNFLHGNELIFTTGIGKLDTADRILEFVKGLERHNAVGVVMNLGPYIKKVPTVVIDYCEKNSFPLFTLPWEVKIIDITYDFCRIIIENEKSEVSVVEAFKHIILTGESKSEFAETFKKMGFQPKNKYRIALIEFFHNGKSVTETFVNNNHMRLWKVFTKSAFSSTMFLMDKKLVVIKQNCSDTQIKKMADTILKSIEIGNMSMVIGISDEETGTEAAAEIYTEAEAAYYTACKGNEYLTFYNDIGLNKLIFGVEDRHVLKKFIEKQLSPLTIYDSENHTDYEVTFRDYLESYSSVKAVSEKSGVHRNTVNYKIKQIREILGGELNAEAKAEFLIAYRIKDLMSCL
ncbi:MAG: PucR family transcriptional regulator ligand-binding domain-containing protein [Candidatus Metalachnospira sp.]|nr:PucR family transcriptional regulator ligand-binding domain-containing protein [Candidatus Metalachnospira sp.]